MKYIFDIDGTLADCSHRLHYILPPELQTIDDLDKFKPDWESFYKDCINDKPIAPTIELLYAIHDYGAKIIYITGRPCKYMNETIQWLKKYIDVPVKCLYMRTNGDHRPDYIVKKEIYETQIKPNLKNESVWGVFEDRKQCVDMWRSLGLTCYQVADGDY